MGLLRSGRRFLARWKWRADYVSLHDPHGGPLLGEFFRAHRPADVVEANGVSVAAEIDKLVGAIEVLPP